jgi:hypothetical protein
MGLDLLLKDGIVAGDDRAHRACMLLPQAGRTLNVGEEENEHLDPPLSLTPKRDAQAMPLVGRAMEPGTPGQVLRRRLQRSESLLRDDILMHAVQGQVDCSILPG